MRRPAKNSEISSVRHIRRLTILVEPDMRTLATLLQLALVWLGVSFSLTGARVESRLQLCGVAGCRTVVGQ